MRAFASLALLFALTACSSDEQDPNQVGDNSAAAIDKAPYAPVNGDDAPTVADLEAEGYVRAEYYPVGCIIPEQPEAACDATGAEFMDKSEVTYEDYGHYEYVCPAIDGVGTDDWKCRKQEQSDG